MENKHNNIDQFYLENLSGHRESLSGEGWNRMKWRLFWLDLRKYLIGFAVLVVVGTVAYFGFFTGSQPDESRTETRLTIEETTNIPSTGQQNETMGIIPVAEEDVMEIQIAENNIPSTERTETLMNTAVKENIPQPAWPEKIESVEEGFGAATGFLQYNLSFVETRKNHPDFLADQEKSPAEEIIIDSISYPYHDIRKNSRVSISFYAAPAYTVSTLNAAPSFGDYLSKRNTHESGTISWSVGADVQFNIKNWYIQTGLNYATFSDKRRGYEALDSLNSYYNNDTTWGWVYDPPDFGKPIVLSIDSSFVPVYMGINEGRNTWRYLEIPLLVGYTFHFNRFSLDLGTGFSYGLLLGASGNVPSLTEENLFTDLSGLESQMSRHNFNYILQIGAAYHLTPQWSLLFQPYYKQNLRSVFENNYPVDQRFKAFSIKFGLKVDL